MRIVADTDEAMSSVSGINKAVGTGSKDRLIVVTSVQLIEMVAIFFVRQSSLLGLTVGLIESVNVGRRSLRLRSGAVTINRLRRGNESSMIVPMGWFGWVRIGALQMDVITLGETLPSVGGKDLASEYNTKKKNAFQVALKFSWYLIFYCSF